MKAFLGNESDLHHERNGRGTESHGGAEISALAFNLCYKKLHSPNRPAGNVRLRRFSP